MATYQSDRLDPGSLWGAGPLLADLRSWVRDAQIVPAGLPVTAGLLSVIVSGLEQVRAMERMARALSARGVPVTRVSNPLAGHPDRYVLEMLDPRSLEVYRVAAPITEPSSLALVRVLRTSSPAGLPQTIQYGAPSVIFRTLRTILGLRR